MGQTALPVCVERCACGVAVGAARVGTDVRWGSIRRSGCNLMQKNGPISVEVCCLLESIPPNVLKACMTLQAVNVSMSVAGHVRSRLNVLNWTIPYASNIKHFKKYPVWSIKYLQFRELRAPGTVLSSHRMEQWERSQRVMYVTWMQRMTSLLRDKYRLRVVQALARLPAYSTSRE